MDMGYKRKGGAQNDEVDVTNETKTIGKGAAWEVMSLTCW